MGQLAMERTGLSRRDLIKGAAAAGAVAWSAPTIVDSLASPAGAATPQNLGANCYRFMYNWRWANEVLVDCDDKWPASSAEGSQNAPAAECSQSFNENNSNQKRTSQSCCRVATNFNPSNVEGTCQSGNIREWYQLGDIPAGCVNVVPNMVCSSSGAGVSVTFSINTSQCGTCWMSDWIVQYADPLSQIGATPPACDNFSLSTSNGGGGLFYSSMTFNFQGNKVPVWFKFTVGCGLVRQAEAGASSDACSDNVPNTQNACLLPGSQVAAGGAQSWNI